MFYFNNNSAVQFSSRWYLCAWKSPYVLRLVSQKFPQRCLWNSSNIRLVDDGPLSSFQGRSSSTSSFHTALLQVISGVMSLALFLQVVSQASQHFIFSEKQATCEDCFSEELKRSGAWDITCGHKARDIKPLIARRREAWKEEALDNLAWKDERGPSSIRRTLELFQRQRLGKLLRDGVERIWDFPSA